MAEVPGPGDQYRWRPTPAGSLLSETGRLVRIEEISQDVAATAERLAMVLKTAAIKGETDDG
tara:strand:- start:290 stop:475 length:186 start_codon:yes stop_codon:yes gene_type:complete